MSTKNEDRRRFLQLGIGASISGSGFGMFSDSLFAETVAELPGHMRGPYAPVADEVSDENLKVTGAIPKDLNGRIFRNGPNPQPGVVTAHSFLGDGMIHGIELRDGKANWYKNRYVRTPLYARPGEDPMRSIANVENSLANTHVIGHNGRILALEELHLPYELAKDLSTIGPYDFGGTLKTGMTAHPKVCPKTGELIAFAYGVVPPYMTYNRISADGRVVQSEQIEVKGATMVHDFNITENYVVFMDLPACWNLESIDGGGIPVEWREDYGARFGVMPRNGTNADVVWYDVDPCYVFHAMNAYEKNGKIIVDACRLPRHFHGDRYSPAYLHKWAIDPKAGKVFERQLDDRDIEFPRINDNFTGLEYRYGYTLETDLANNGQAFRYVKYDMQKGTSELHELGKGRTGGEPVFVAATGAKTEDDGWVLCWIYDEANEKSELVILDAMNMQADPVARVHLAVRVPSGFHGSWIPDSRVTG